MTKKIGFFLFLALIIHCHLLAQVRVSGSVVDENNEPIPFANILLKGSIKGTVSDEKGKFYIEADEYYKEMEVTFMGYEKAIVPLEINNYNLVIILKEDADILKEVTVYSGRVKNKNNPAIDILRKIWEKKRKNGLNLYNDYEYSKYEKIEFDLNNIDEKFKSSKVFKGMEFIFDLFPDMRGFMKQRAGTLSGGQQQMLAVARALMNDNELLLIDEPTEGLSPLLAKNLINALDRLTEFATILLVEQNFRTVSRLGDNYYIFDNGKIVHEGNNMDELVANKQLVSQYLGVRI